MAFFVLRARCLAYYNEKRQGVLHHKSYPQFGLATLPQTLILIHEGFIPQTSSGGDRNRGPLQNLENKSRLLRHIRLVMRVGFSPQESARPHH